MTKIQRVKKTKQNKAIADMKIQKRRRSNWILSLDKYPIKYEELKKVPKKPMQVCTGYTVHEVKKVCPKEVYEKTPDERRKDEKLGRIQSKLLGEEQQMDVEEGYEELEPMKIKETRQGLTPEEISKKVAEAKKRQELAKKKKEAQRRMELKYLAQVEDKYSVQEPIQYVEKVWNKPIKQVPVKQKYFPVLRKQYVPPIHGLTMEEKRISARIEKKTTEMLKK